MLDHREAPDRIDPSDANEPMEKALNEDPIDPIDRNEPTDPMESTEPFDPMDRIEFVERTDHRDPPARSGEALMALILVHRGIGPLGGG